MTTDEKNYIASRYHDYVDCLPEHRQPEKAEAIKQLMDYFGINELGQNTDSNTTVEQDGATVSLTSFGSRLLEMSYLKEMSLNELRGELERMKLWRESIRKTGQPENLIGVDELVELLESKIEELESMDG